MVDAAVSKTAELSSCGFESHLRYHCIAPAAARPSKTALDAARDSTNVIAAQRPPEPRAAAHPPPREVGRWAALATTVAALIALSSPFDVFATDSIYGDPLGQPKTPKLPIDGQRFDASFRFRGVYAQNRTSLDSARDDASREVHQRMRVGAAFGKGPVDAYFQVQSAGTLGSPARFDADSSSSRVGASLGLQQGWARWRWPLIDGFEVQAGRMALEYGAGRRIGRYDFHETGNAFDGVRVGWKPGDFVSIDLLAVRIRAADSSSDTRTLLGTYIVTKPASIITTDVYFLFADDRGKSRAENVNMGLRVVLRPWYWMEWDAEGAVQYGTVTPQGYSNPLDHLATSLATELRMRGHLGVPLGFNLRFQRHSGDNDTVDDASAAWRPLYPSLARQVGVLQLFPQSNLVQYGIGVRIGDRNDVRVLVDTRFSGAMSHSRVPAFNQPVLKFDDTWAPLGTEVNARAVLPTENAGEIQLVGALFSPSAVLSEHVGEATMHQYFVQWALQF